MAPLRVVAFLLIAFSSAGCAAKKPPAPPRDLLAESTAYFRAGCYRCLQEGLALLDGRTDLPSRQRAFELALVLAARSKELGLAFEPWAERAKALAASLPPAASATEFLALLGVLRLDPSGLDRNQDLAQRHNVASPDELRRLLTAIDASDASVEARTYFGLAAACTVIRDQHDAQVARARPLAAGVPLLEYALGSCDSREIDTLRQALESEPRFDDAAYPLGRYLYNPRPPGGSEPDAADAFARARSAFPESAAIVYAEADLFRARYDWSRALDGFDATLRLVPTHHDARLGRAIALSNLARHDEAIAAATSLVDEGTWLAGEAYYWRAWNQFTLGRLDESERDVEQAKQRTRWSPVLVLSGLVQWRKQRLTVAEGELERAVSMAPDNCNAVGYLGGVRAALRKWLPAGQAFASATTCHEGETRSLRDTLDDLIARGASEGAIAAQRKSVADSEQESAEMSRNRDISMANALAAYRLRPTAYCPLPSESHQP